MGSLLPGWDSPLASPRQGALRRTTSLTNEEIEKFWKVKHEIEEEHLNAAAVCQALKAQLQKKRTEEEEEEEEATQQSPSQKPLGAKVSSVEEYIRRSTTYKDWWTKSSWAFLNEPVMEQSSHKSFVAKHNILLSPPSTQQLKSN